MCIRDRLEEENARLRLREALDRIREHLQAIDHIMQGLSEVDKTHMDSQFTDDDVKNLLKKYSRL